MSIVMTVDFKRYPQLACILIAVAIMAAGLKLYDPARGNRVDENPLAGFPLVIDGWSGDSRSMNSGIVDFLNLSDYLLIDYQSAADRVNMYIAYYRSLNDEAFPHSPRKCIPGGGWEIDAIDDIRLAQREVRRVKITRDGYTQLVYYWYQQGSDSMADEYRLKWNTMLRSLGERRTDTSLVRLTTLIDRGESEAVADARLRSFATALDSELAARFN